jgi:hypothetical protein
VCAHVPLVIHGYPYAGVPMYVHGYEEMHIETCASTSHIAVISAVSGCAYVVPLLHVSDGRCGVGDWQVKKL